MQATTAQSRAQVTSISCASHLDALVARRRLYVRLIRIGVAKGKNSE
jgi:hypothetical protein